VSSDGWRSTEKSLLYSRQPEKGSRLGSIVGPSIIIESRRVTERTITRSGVLLLLLRHCERKTKRPRTGDVESRSNSALEKTPTGTSCSSGSCARSSEIVALASGYEERGGPPPLVGPPRGRARLRARANPKPGASPRRDSTHAFFTG
jgi:hypothetical protein